uniref:nucleoside hydrolase n=1 Tax=Pararhizobium sp. IMCC3301 TaxID=3067904 RepID=UPI00274152AC|nr:nucleoside hydrolase [Pararhizobium sp. IMCC3301]
MTDPTTASRQKIIIDTDPGVDDALAIHLAFADPRLEVVGLTTVFGNVHTYQATRNARHLVEMAGLAIPVAHGAEKPYQQPSRDPAHFIHGHEGFGDQPAPAPVLSVDPRSAAQFICDMADLHGKELILCPVGPLTNLAHALDLDPALPGKIGGVVLMGGAVTVPGNVNSYAEANIHNDPHAAEMVFAAAWDVRVIGLDVTEQILCSLQHLEEIAAASPQIGGFLRDVSAFYIRFYQQARAFDGCCLHDPAAVIAITDPDWFSYHKAPVKISLEGDTLGSTRIVAEANRPGVRFAVGCEADKIRAHFVATLMQADQLRAQR